MSNPNDIVAVKLEGCFTEWYSPNYKEPFEDNAEFRKFYEENLIGKQPVVGPVLEGVDGHWIGGDLIWLADRLTCGARHWQAARESLCTEVKASLADGKTRTWKDADCTIANVKITPFTKAAMPPLTDDALEMFGKFGYLIRERYEAI